MSTVTLPKNDDWLLDPLGKEKSESFILIKQRDQLQAYLIATVIFQWVTFIIASAQIWIFFNVLKLFLKFIYLIAYALFSYLYITNKMESLLDELNYMIALQHKLLWIK